MKTTVLNGLSIDVEEAFHASAFEGIIDPATWPERTSRVESNVDRLLELLDRRLTHATFFVLGWIAERHPRLVRRIHAAGHEIASHGYNHRLIYHQSPDEFRQDVVASKQRLEDIIGEPVVGYRAPTYSITRRTLWALDILAEAGYRYDSSIFPVYHDRYGVAGAPRFPYRLQAPSGATLVELPPTTLSLGLFNLPVAGGGYFRLYPFAVTRAAVTVLNRLEHQPALVYVHPWEIDPAQPRLTRKRFRWWRHTVNTDKTLHRLDRLLAHHRFGPLDRIVGALPDMVPVTLAPPAPPFRRPQRRAGIWAGNEAADRRTGTVS